MSVLAVVGSRDYPRLSEVRHYVRSRIASTPGIVICSGGARGVDTEAERAATMFGAEVVSFRPVRCGDWYGIVRLWWAPNFSAVGGFNFGSATVGTDYLSYGAAAFARNELIVAEAHQVIAFWDGMSSGTKHTLALARKQGNLIEAEGSPGRPPSDANTPPHRPAKDRKENHASSSHPKP